jgi:hypothetical protein
MTQSINICWDALALVFMNESSPGPRQALLREAAILQFKLLVDGLRDAALIPMSLIAAAIGLMRGGDDSDREFRRVIKLGRRSERWINLFGHQPPLRPRQPGGSLDDLLDRVEAVVMEQYRQGRSEAEARDAISKAIQEVVEEPEKKAAP